MAFENTIKHTKNNTVRYKVKPCEILTLVTDSETSDGIKSASQWNKVNEFGGIAMVISIPALYRLRLSGNKVSNN